MPTDNSEALQRLVESWDAFDVQYNQSMPEKWSVIVYSGIYWSGGRGCTLADAVDAAVKAVEERRATHD